MRTALLFLSLCFASGYASVFWNNKETVKVFVVSHSHDDPGWLRPVDEYYEYEVQYILDSVVTALSENPLRKFIQVEMSFFTRWWREQSAQKREQVRTLLSNGQLEFINGGWVMNDEATTNYIDIINQMTEGHQFLLNEFNVTPTVAWHIDPFGSSNMSPALWAMMGFNASVINRIDYRIKGLMKASKELEFVWRGSKSLSTAADMFAHVMDSHYCTPKGFNWEHGVTQDLPQGDGPPPMIVIPPSYLTQSNLHERAVEWANISLTRAAWYGTPNVLIPFGCDFNFQNALMKYKNMDRLMEYVNKHSHDLGIEMQYSTLSDYFIELYEYQRIHGKQWKVLGNDFFPYASDNISYWAGYYTSRPDLKQLSREASNILRNVESLSVLSNALLSTESPNQNLAIDLLRKASALVQHHDAITGTERRVTYRDYRKRLQDGVIAANNISVEAMQRISGFKNLTSNNELLHELLLRSKNISVLLYNSLEQSRKQIVKLVIPYEIESVTVSLPNGTIVPHQISLPLSYGETGKSLYFSANVPAIGYQLYCIQVNETATNNSKLDPSSSKFSNREKVELSNDYFSAEFSPVDGQLQSMTRKYQNQTKRVSSVQSIRYYTPVDDLNQSSDAYIFRPSYKLPETYLHVISSSVHHGELVDELQLVYNESSIVQVFRVFKGLDEMMSSYLELETHIGPINISNTVTGKEFVTHFQTDIKNEGVFYTDNNGMEMQARYTHSNGRPGDNDTGVELAGYIAARNYYPVVSRIFLNQSEWQWTILTSHSMGGSSLNESALELMIHRRCLINDRRGVGQPLNDTHTTTPIMWLISADQNQSAELQRHLANLLQYPMQVFFSTEDSKGKQSRYSALQQDLPINLRLISIKKKVLQKQNQEIILRIMNIFAQGEHPVYSQPTTIDLNTIFAPPLYLTEIEERTLTTALPASANIRPHWNTGEESIGSKLERKNSNTTEIEIAPMEIRTFWATLSISP